MSLACVPKNRYPDMSDLNTAIDYAKSLGRGMVVFRHPMSLRYDVALKSQTHKYDLSWVAYEVR